MTEGGNQWRLQEAILVEATVAGVGWWWDAAGVAVAERVIRSA